MKVALKSENMSISGPQELWYDNFAAFQIRTKDDNLKPAFTVKKSTYLSPK